MTSFALISEVPPLRYGLIMADPPWHFSNWSVAGEKKNATAQYGCMDLSAIKGMPISTLAARDCILWLWATNPMLPHALDVIDAWGFQFKTAGHWVKKTKTGKTAFGTGYCLRSAGEPFLIATIGAPKFHSKSVRSVIEAEAREHSRKPEAAYTAAEALAGPHVWRLDLFSRQERPGWDAFGNETDKFQEAAE